MPNRTVAPRVRSLCALLVAVVLGVAALPALGATAATAAADTRVTTGTITWGVKASFRDYLTQPFAQGSAATTPPATTTGEGFVFPAATGTWGDARSDVAAQGAVRFRAHDDALDVTLSTPRLVVEGDAAHLQVDALDSEGTQHPGLVIAEVDLDGKVVVDGGAVTISGAPATLTAEGAALFSYQGRNFYEPGSDLDPVSARFTLQEAPEPSEPTNPEPTTPTDPGTPSEPSTPPAPQESEITGGSLSWGFKDSFRSYLKMPFVGSTTEVIAPAADNGTQTTFRPASGTWDDKRVDVRTRGGVRFTGHHGVMDFTVQNLRLVVDAERSHLRADVRDSGGRNHAGLVFATVDLRKHVKVAGDTVTISGAPVTLTKAGEAMFDYTGSPMYTANTPLAPLNGTITVKGATAPPTTKPTKPSDPKPSKPARPAKPGVDREREAAKRGGKAGELTWGVKASFRTYITGSIAKGSISVSGGASSTGGAFRFGQTSTTATPPSATGTTTYGGAVKFYGHEGKLDRAISQPSVRVTSPLTAVLSANVTGMGRIDLATLSLSSARKSTEDGWVRYAGAPARLTSAGTAVFAYQGRGFYPAGTVLDPVTFSVGTTAAARTGGSAGSRVVAATNRDAKWTPPAEAPSGTGLSVDQDDIQAGDEITATAEGFLPNETGIRVVLYSTPMVLAENVTADASGRATWKGTIPATIEPGRHTLTFQGSVDRGIVLDIAAADEIVGCKLADAKLEWGFKESFRAYISGGIANGDWTTGGNAGYETPQFRWTKGAGVMAEKGDTGTLDFTGHVQFTGHDGALDTRVADPVVTFTSQDKAVLALDYTGGTMDAALAGENDSRTLGDVPFADLDLAAGTVERQGDRVTISDIPATLTSAGSNAFPNYPAGTALDPVTLSYTTTKDCGAPSTKDEAKSATTAVALDPITPAGSTTWWPWAVGGALLAGLAGAAGTFLVMRRRTPGADA